MELLSRDRGSLVARLDVRLKLALGFSISLLVVLVDSLAFLSGLAASGILLFLFGKPNRSQVKLLVITGLLMVWGLMLSQALFYNRYPRQVLLVILRPNSLFEEGLNIYLQGTYHGMVQSLRMLAVTSVGYAICFSTEPDQFLGGLVSFKVPFSLAFMAVTAIRFIPVVVEEYLMVRSALRLKGYRPLKVGLLRTVQVEIGSLRPVLAASIRRSEELALSIQTRGFTLDGQRCWLVQPGLGGRQWIYLVVLMVLVSAVAVCKILFWLYRHEIFYTPSFREIYFFSREWL